MIPSVVAGAVLDELGVGSGGWIWRAPTYVAIFTAWSALHAWYFRFINSDRC